MSESNAHLTKQDLLEVEGPLLGAIHGEMEKLGTSLHADIERVGTRLHADIEGFGNRLSTHFPNWGHAFEQKMRRVEFSNATTVERLSILEERIFTLERRVAGNKE
jgi:hypothetical protein